MSNDNNNNNNNSENLQTRYDMIMVFISLSYHFRGVSHDEGIWCRARVTAILGLR